MEGPIHFDQADKMSESKVWLDLAAVRAGCLDSILAIRRGEHDSVAWPWVKEL